jgi:hypothetical protein
MVRLYLVLWRKRRVKDLATHQLWYFVRRDLMQLVNFWLLHNGFSIGICNPIADQKTVAYMDQYIAKHKWNVADIIGCLP